jgi:predicted protein tyrosine phosphatase
MSSVLSTESEPVLAVDDEIVTKEARRLYSAMFGSLLDDADDTPSLICERLFLGSAPDARNLDKLQRHRIKYVLNMTGSASYPIDFFTASGYPHVTLLTLDAHDEDNYDISAHFPVALDFIHKSLQAGDGAVLVHCAAGEKKRRKHRKYNVFSLLYAGVSRSATIVAAYLMAAHQISAADAVLRVHQARACVCPNLGFLRRLLRFERTGFKFT